jgi:predicted MFS family arabinose efflux permease
MAAAPQGRTWMAASLLVLVGGGAVIALSIGIRQSFGLFLQPMSEALGSGREVFAMAIAVQNLVWGATQPFFGAAADRWGAGRVVAASGLLYALGLYLMGAGSSEGELYLSGGLVIGLALSGTSFAVVLGAVGRAFTPDQRPMALGLASAGGSFGQFAMVPLGQAFISEYGWSLALMIMAALALSMVLLAMTLAQRAENQPVAAPSAASLGEAMAEARHHRGYHLLVAGFFVCGFHITFIATHLPAYLNDRGLAADEAAFALALIGLFNIFGSIACGMAGGRFAKKNVLALLYLARAVVILGMLLAPLAAWSAYVFTALMGLLWLGTVPLTSALVAQVFGPRYMGALFGIVFFSHQIGAFIGVWLGGYVYDLTGSYDVVWWISIVLGLVAAALHWPINERPLVRVATG